MVSRPSRTTINGAFSEPPELSHAGRAHAVPIKYAEPPAQEVRARTARLRKLTWRNRCVNIAKLSDSIRFSRAVHQPSSHSCRPTAEPRLTPIIPACPNSGAPASAARPASAGQGQQLQLFTLLRCSMDGAGPHRDPCVSRPGTSDWRSTTR